MATRIGRVERVERVQEPKKVNTRTREGCIFYLYGEQKPLGGLNPNFFWW